MGKKIKICASALLFNIVLQKNDNAIKRENANKPIKLFVEGMVIYKENHEKSRIFFKSNKILAVSVFNKKITSIHKTQLYFICNK